jgi:hypothetical protein
MAGLLRGYQLYLRPIPSRPKARSSDPADLFDSDSFLRSRDKAYHRFYGILVDTQMFTHFIQERSFTSSKDASLAFFDDVVEKLEHEEMDGSFRLLDRDSSHNQNAAMILPPEPDDLPEGVTYSYNVRSNSYTSSQFFLELVHFLFEFYDQVKISNFQF